MTKLTHVMNCIRTRATPSTDTFYTVMIIIRISTSSLFWIIYIFIILNHLHLHYFESSEAFFKISSKQWSQAQSQYSSYLKAVSSWKKKQKTVEIFTIMRTVIHRRNHIKIVGTKHNFKDLFLATLLVSLIFANLETLSNSPNVFFYSYIYFSSKHLLNY